MSPQPFDCLLHSLPCFRNRLINLRNIARRLYLRLQFVCNVNKLQTQLIASQSTAAETFSQVGGGSQSENHELQERQAIYLPTISARGWLYGFSNFNNFLILFWLPSLHTADSALQLLSVRDSFLFYLLHNRHRRLNCLTAFYFCTKKSTEFPERQNSIKTAL